MLFLIVKGTAAQPQKPIKQKLPNNTCSCLVQKPLTPSKAVYPSLTNVVPYSDFTDLTGWALAYPATNFEHLFIKNHQVEVSKVGSSSSLSVIANREPIRLTNQEKAFTLNLTPCTNKGQLYELPMTVQIEYPVRNYIRNFDYKSFDHTAEPYLDVILKISSADPEILLKDALQNLADEPPADSTGTLNDHLKSIRDKYKIDIESKPTGNDHSEVIIKELIARLVKKKIDLVNLLLQEFILTSPDVHMINAIEGDRLVGLISKQLNIVSIETFDKEVLQTKCTASLDIAYLGIEFGSKILNQPGSQNVSILAKAAQTEFDNVKGFSTNLTDICLAPTKIAGSDISVRFDNFKIITNWEQRSDALVNFNNPLMSRGLPSTSKYLAQAQSNSLAKFTGLMVPNASLEIPFKNAHLTVAVKDLLINNNMLAGKIEFPLFPGKPLNVGQVRLKTGNQIIVTTINQIQRELIHQKLTAVNLVELQSTLIAYFIKYKED